MTAVHCGERIVRIQEAACKLISELHPPLFRLRGEPVHDLLAPLENLAAGYAFFYGEQPVEPPLPLFLDKKTLDVLLRDACLL